MNKPEVARLFFIQLDKLYKAPTSYDAKYMELNALLTKLFFYFTEEENLHFSTMFARIAFACHKYDISKAVQWRIHSFRRKYKDYLRKKTAIEESEYLSTLKTTAFAVSAFCQTPVPQELKKLLPNDDDAETQKVKLRAKERIDVPLKVLVLEVDEENELLTCQVFDERFTDTVKVRYNETSYNEQYTPTILRIRDIYNSKATVNLMEILVDEDGVLHPKIFVLEPDYLVDVTSVAECFQDFGSSPYLYLLSKFRMMENTKPLMVGNIANHFLDELMTNSNADFKEVFPKVFKLNPLGFADFDDQQIREIYNDCLRHFSTLKNIIRNELSSYNIDVRHCYLEPSFYSARYGLQGRLDVWHQPSGSTKADIIELKSGSPWKPNRFGLSNSHYTQTMLYDLLVRSVYNGIEVAEFILYSKLETEQMRFAPIYKYKQDEAIQVRNDIVALERMLSILDKRPLDQVSILNRIHPSYIKGASGFTAKAIELFSSVLERASDLERRYFLSFVSFTAREHQLSKTGVEGNDSLNGLASLWLNELEEKDHNYSILSDLELLENHAAEELPILVLGRTKTTNPLANFRQGDIVVLYPRIYEYANVLSHQIFKGAIIEIDSEKVTVKLHSRQFNDVLFHQHAYWYIEGDVMDKSYGVQYGALFSFLQAKSSARELILTTRPPRQVVPQQLQFENPYLSQEQKNVLQKALATKDYFLLVGPPGTGKTKFMLAELLRWLLKNTNENVLLLAYTNRAVDEICEAIHDFAENDYLRMGSRYSCDERFEHRMFSVVTEKVEKRAELIDIIEKHRVFVSTVATIINRPLILKLKKFDTVVLDEASQILEPMLVGMLPSFGRFIMIGDHKQLPAVVLQDKEHSAVKDELLLEIGLSNRRNSLFERLYVKSQQNNWNWAYDMLSHQGRMHGDISEFPNKYFYHGTLNLLPQEEGKEGWQLKPLQFKTTPDSSPLTQLLAQKRVHYFPTEVDYDGNPKTNLEEAQKIGELVDAFRQLYEENNLEFKPENLGVITPWRSQIAQIRHVLEKYGKGYENCTIDTVERYQGGARDIVLISICLNMPYQLDAVVSLSDDELVDRKLNVALTRARQHLVLVGNEQLMRMDKRYNHLLDWIQNSKVS